MDYRSWFSRLSKAIAFFSGHPITFLSAVLSILIWALLGPLFHFSDTWQLVINTATTIVTFLMVFLIQNTQNRDAQAIQLKLDEIIRSLEGAHNVVINLENLSDKELEQVQARYAELAEKARKAAEHGREDTDVPLVDVPVGKPGDPLKDKTA